VRLFKHEPSDWRELQNFVGKLLGDCGYTVEVSKKVALVRGTKEIDVFVTDTEAEFKSTFLIECKNWNKPAHQETVHAFHTVVNDYGANFGFIVSKSGFQSGCFEAAENTNIKLVSLKDLEERFYKKWVKGMVKKFMPVADELFPYWDYPGKQVKDGMPLDWDKRNLLLNAYRPITSLNPFDIMHGFKRKYPQLIPVLNDQLEIEDYISITDDCEYFEFVEAKKEDALRHFKIFYREL
jgi:hypothetical protein